MSSNDFTEFFSQIFTALDTKDSFLILLFLLGAFLIGWVFGRWSMRSKYRKLQEAFKTKETELITVNANYSALQERYTIREEELNASRAELEEMEAAHRALETEKSHLSGELYTLREQCDQLKISNSQYETEILSLNNNIDRLQQVIENQQTVGVGVGGDDEIEEVDLNLINEGINLPIDNDQTNQRLATIEAKIAALESENENLKSTLSNIETPSVLTLPAISESEDELSAEEKSVKARLEITRLLGDRIELVASNNSDDLKLINGVGPFIEEKLNEIGIYTFKQISQFDSGMINLITDAIQFFPGRIERDQWVDQAKQLMK